MSFEEPIEQHRLQAMQETQEYLNILSRASTSGCVAFFRWENLLQQTRTQLQNRLITPEQSAAVIASIQQEIPGELKKLEDRSYQMVLRFRPGMRVLYGDEKASTVVGYVKIKNKWFVQIRDKNTGRVASANPYNLSEGWNERMEAQDAGSVIDTDTFAQEFALDPRIHAAIIQRATHGEAIAPQGITKVQKGKRTIHVSLYPKQAMVPFLAHQLALSGDVILSCKEPSADVHQQQYRERAATTLETVARIIGIGTGELLSWMRKRHVHPVMRDAVRDGSTIGTELVEVYTGPRLGNRACVYWKDEIVEALPEHLRELFEQGIEEEEPGSR
ncbi:MAG: hypothetical protein AAB728_03145 [Patescibacteria group bacterium]